MKKGHTLIVGAGITGLCSAYYLVKKGWKVTVIDKNDMKDNCSYGNAGMIVPSHFIPLAAPGVIAQGIRWLFNKKSPFYIKPSLNRKLIDWGWKFYKSSTKQHVQNSADFIKQLNVLGREEYRQLHSTSELNFDLKNTGILMLYRTATTEKEEAETAEMAKSMGIDCEILYARGIQDLEPDLQFNIRGGVQYKSDGFINPPQFMQEMHRVLKELGVEFVTHAPVTKFETATQKIVGVYAGGQRFEADQYVLATGADLDQQAKLLQLKIPMMPGKGYSFYTEGFEGKIKNAALLMDDKVSITPMGNRVRIGGTMELGVKNPKINQDKIKGIREAVAKYYPGVNLEELDESKIWYGYRPCSPDGLPYLGRSNTWNNLIIAGGSGMMGMSCGPAFGKLVKEIVNEEVLSMDISIFHPERFN